MNDGRRETGMAMSGVLIGMVGEGRPHTEAALTFRQVEYASCTTLPRFKGMLIEQPSVAHSRIAVTRPETLPRSRRILRRQRQVEMPLTSKIKVMMSPPGRILRERDQRKTSADRSNKVAPSKAKAPGSERC
jgi:hypothetical protein